MLILDSCAEIGSVGDINFPGYRGTTDKDSYMTYRKSVINVSERGSEQVGAEPR
jgi:hypothetical protein